jgi:hypothetical protein
MTPEWRRNRYPGREGLPEGRISIFRGSKRGHYRKRILAGIHSSDRRVKARCFMRGERRLFLE